jgi:hypothetical protein
MKKLRLGDSSCLGIELIRTSDGKKMLSLRKFYQKKDSEDWLPTRSGLTIPIEKAMQLRKAMRVVCEDTKTFTQLEEFKRGKKKVEEEETTKKKKKKVVDEDDDDTPF